MEDPSKDKDNDISTLSTQLSIPDSSEFEALVSKWSDGVSTWRDTVRLGPTTIHQPWAIPMIDPATGVSYTVTPAYSDITLNAAPPPPQDEFTITFVELYHPIDRMVDENTLESARISAQQIIQSQIGITYDMIMPHVDWWPIVESQADLRRRLGYPAKTETEKDA